MSTFHEQSRSFEVTNRYLTKTLTGLSHLFLVATVDTTVLLNNEITMVKLKMSLRLTKHHAIKTHWGSGDWFHAFLTSALRGG